MSPALGDRLDRTRPLGAFVLGRAGMDLYPVEDGGKIGDAAGFTTDVGGSAGNIAVALARLGVKAGLIGAVSDDPVGRFVLKRLGDFGVDTRAVQTVAGDPRTSLALAEVRSEDCEVTIYRNNAADLRLETDAGLRRRMGEAAVLVVTGTALVADPSRQATLDLLEAAREVGAMTVFDLDYRAYSWASADETAAVYEAAVKLSDVVVGNVEEFAVFVGDGGEATARALADGAGRCTIVKRGADGASVFGSGWRIDSGVYPVAAMKPYGAGDAFIGGLVGALLNEFSLEDAIRRGSAAAAMVVSRRGCASAMPTAEQLDAFMSSSEMTLNPTRNDHAYQAL